MGNILLIRLWEMEAMQTKKLAAIFTALLTCVSLVVAGCGGKDSASSGESSGGVYKDKISRGCTSWVGYAPLRVAGEKGFFKDEGLDVEMRVIESAGDIKSALKSGQIKGMAQTIDTEVMANSAGLKLKEVLPLCNSNGGDGIVAKKEYSSLADLKGKTIALDTTGGASLFWFNNLLDAQGMTMQDFDVKNMSAGDAGSAFVGGQVDAAVTWEPWLSNANKTTFGKTLVTSKASPGVIVDALCFDSDFAAKNPKTVQTIIKVWFKAVQYAKDHPDEAYPIMAKSQNMSVDDFKAQLPNIEYFNEDMTKDYLIGGKMAEMAQKASDLWIKMKLMTEPVKGTDIVDASFAKAALGL